VRDRERARADDPAGLLEEARKVGVGGVGLVVAGLRRAVVGWHAGPSCVG
jgi:hypothetical protein